LEGEAPWRIARRRFFGELEDPRTGNAKRHLLHEVLMIALCTVLCGGETCADMALFGRAKREFFQQFLTLPHGIPSHDTFSRIFRLLDPQHFHRLHAALCVEVTATDTSGLSASETFAVATPSAPTVNVSSFTVAVQQSVAASSFFTISNPSNDSITEYSFKDNGGGSGYFTLAGTAEPDVQVITVSASNLNSVQYVGGSSAGTDTLTVDAYDATTGTWVPSVSFSAVTTAAYPLANINDVTEALYIGYFGRAGDPGGVAYWLNQLNAGIISETSTAASFSVQTETTTLYPFLASPSTASQAQITSFIESVYADLFDRAADSGGLAYWDSYLTNNLGNPQAVGDFILTVIRGALGTDQTTISNKVTVADYFTQELAAAGIGYTSAASTLAHSAIASVTSAASTVLAAESTISSWVATTTQSTDAEVALVGMSHTSLLSTVH
jgi:hypothetical protein